MVQLLCCTLYLIVLCVFCLHRLYAPRRPSFIVSPPWSRSLDALAAPDYTKPSFGTSCAPDRRRRRHQRPSRSYRADGGLSAELHT